MLYVPSTVVVPGDAAATAEKLVAFEGLVRLGILGDLVIVSTEVVLTSLLYVLFRPVDATLALGAAFARLAMTVVQATNLTNTIAALVMSHERSPLALRFMEVHGQVVHVWETLFALHCVLLGVLIWRWGQVPKILGPLMALAGVGYLANGVGNLLAPEAGAFLQPLVAVTSVCGELPFFVWILTMGIRGAPRPQPGSQHS
jgi:hypothetical protein